MLLAPSRRWVLGSLALLGFGRPAAALDPSRSVTQYARSVWRAPQALPHDSVTAIVQTRDGYLWLGTVEGLARFDGVRSVLFDKRNTPAFSDNWVKSLLEDHTGRLWIGTYGGGLVCLENGRFASYGAERGLPYDAVMALLEDRAGHLWAGTLGGGALRFDGDRFVRPPGTESVATSTVRALHEGRDGTLWIGSESGLFHLRGGVMTRMTRADGLTDDTILSLAEDDQGLWIGTERGGLNQLHEGRLTSITPRDGLAHERVWCLTVDRDGNLWIGTDGGGLQRLSQGKLASLSARNGLTNNYVWAIREDREGSVWIGTNGGGLNRLRIGRVLTLTTYDGLPSDFVWAVRGTRDGALWIATDDAGIARMQDGRVTTLITRRDGISSNRVRSLAEGRDGSLWIGGSGGLDRWVGGRVTLHAVPGLPNDSVNALLEGRDGTLWIGTTATGVLAAKDGRLRAFSQGQGLPVAYVSYLLEARDGSIWVGTRNGVAHIQGDQVASYTRANGLPHSSVGVLFEDPVSGVWVGTRGGLARIRGDRVTTLTTRQGLHEDAIVSAVVGDDGALWLGGNLGLSRVPFREVEEVMEGRRARVDPLVLGSEDGMANPEANGGGPSAWKGKGRLWFATRGGVVEVDPAGLAASQVPPQVRIEQVRADGRVLDGTGPWSLTPGTRRLVFEFTALSFRAPSRLGFRHRLEGFDTDWQGGAPSRTAEYTNLSHGSYRFHVIAANEDGVWGEEGAAVSFRIEPRLHERPWIRGVAGALLFAGALSFYFVRVRQLRRRHDLLEQLVAARTAEIEAANARLAQLSFEDPLTGVANRRRLDEVLEETWRRACRHGGSLAVLILDADFFKPFNDQLGHPAGDAALRAVAATLAESHRRAGELVARYGGEEFAVLLPDVSRDDALRAAESARERIEGLAIPHPGSAVSSFVTVSVGVAWTEPTSQASPAELVEAADRALYQAKGRGRNRVESASAPFAAIVPAS